jgi:inosine-uridine nucleoside N-ribohydrolase
MVLRRLRLLTGVKYISKLQPLLLLLFIICASVSFGNKPWYNLISDENCPEPLKGECFISRKKNHDNMLYKVGVFIAFSIFALTGCARHDTNKPVSVIFDSDIGPDYDDVGAITILHVLEQKGEARILATIASNKYEGIAAILNIFNTYFHRPEIPIGVPKGNAVSMRDSQHWTDTLLKKYPHAIKFNREVPGAVTLYRKVLAAQPDHSVTIVTVGFLTNIAGLLTSKGDSISPLTGEELIREKVKLLVSMAGKYPSGKEFNIYNDTKSSKEALEHWPTKVIFSGFEIGEKIKTGLPLVKDKNIQHDPAKDVFSLCIPMAAADSAGRMSWDETAVLVAVRGYKPYFDIHPGRIRIAADGSDTWDDKGKGEYYLVAREPASVVARTINRLMMQEPEKE